MIADDNPGIRRGLRLLLEKHSGRTIYGEPSNSLEAVPLLLFTRHEISSQMERKARDSGSVAL